jgi:uncharacterized protein (DUF849 family)
MLTVCVAPTGARRTKADHPSLPLTPDEVAGEAASCLAVGARAIHLHIRDDTGQHTLEAERYRVATAAVRNLVGDEMVVQITTEAVGRYQPAEQMALVRELRPEAISVAVGEIIPDKSSESIAREFFSWAHAEGIGVQYIVYSADQARELVTLSERRIVSDMPHALFVLGRYTRDQESNPRDLLPFLTEWPADWPWTMCAFGKAESACAAAAIALGGHVRVGFENNFFRPDGSRAARNADLVENVRTLAAASGRRLASVDEARRLYCGIRTTDRS